MLANIQHIQTLGVTGIGTEHTQDLESLDIAHGWKGCMHVVENGPGTNR